MSHEKVDARVRQHDFNPGDKVCLIDDSGDEFHAPIGSIAEVVEFSELAEEYSEIAMLIRPEFIDNLFVPVRWTFEPSHRQADHFYAWFRFERLDVD